LAIETVQISFYVALGESTATYQCTERLQEAGAGLGFSQSFPHPIARGAVKLCWVFLEVPDDGKDYVPDVAGSLSGTAIIWRRLHDTGDIAHARSEGEPIVGLSN